MRTKMRNNTEEACKRKNTRGGRSTRALAIRLTCSMDYPYRPSEQKDSEGIPPLVLAHCLSWYKLLSGLCGLRELFVGQSKTALSSLIIEQGTQQIVAAKIGPEHRGKIELSIGSLPQQEVAQAFFPTGTDQ